EKNVQVLLSVGVNPNSRTLSNDETFLMTVSKNKRYHDVVPILLEAEGIKLDERDNGGRTALMHLMSAATNKSDLQLVFQLIDKGAECELTDVGGDTVRNYADRAGFGKEVREYIEQRSVGAIE